MTYLSTSLAWRASCGGDAGPSTELEVEEMQRAAQPARWGHLLVHLQTSSQQYKVTSLLKHVCDAEGGLTGSVWGLLVHQRTYLSPIKSLPC